MPTDLPAHVDPRVARSCARIVDATRAELADRGYAGLTIEGVAARAGVGKATVYRHYANKASLVAAAMEAAPSPGPVPDTGDLRRDVLAILTGLVERTSTGDATLLPVLVDAAERDAVLAEHRHTWVRARRRPLRLALQAGIARGELPASADLELLADLLTGPLFYRRFVSRTPIDRDYLATLVATVLP